MCVSIKYIENESKSYDKTDFRDNTYCNQSLVNKWSNDHIGNIAFY